MPESSTIMKNLSVGMPAILTSFFFPVCIPIAIKCLSNSSCSEEMCEASKEEVTT